MAGTPPETKPSVADRDPVTYQRLPLNAEDSCTQDNAAPDRLAEEEKQAVHEAVTTRGGGGRGDQRF